MAKVSSTTSSAAIATVDLAKVSATAFAEAVAKIDAEGKRLRKAGELPDIAVKTGKMRITPDDAEKMLLHNGGNRKVRLSHVQELAAQMQNGGWKLAQPIIFDDEDDLLDGQNRLFAIYFGGATVDQMVMVVPTQPDLFAYIDTGRGRSASDALYTAGMDGVSSPAAAAAKLLYRYERRQLGVFKQPKLLRLANNVILEYVRTKPSIIEATRMALDEFPTAVSVIGDKGVAGAFAYLIGEHFEDDVLVDFYNALGVDGNLTEDHPITALRRRLENAGVTEEKLSNPRKLALLIKAFIMDATNQKVGKKGVFLRDNEAFPRIEEAANDTQAA